MLTAQSIQDKVDSFVRSEIKTYPCNNLRASNVGHPCARYLYLLIKHWEEQEAHDEGLQNIFDLGNSIEDYTINKLKNSGIQVLLPQERSWKVENPLITGREDLRILDEETGQFFPAEVKGLSPFEWEKLNTIEDFYNSKHYYVQAYPAQLLVYMWKFEKEKGFFVLTNKLTGEIKIIQVAFDWDRADALLKKAESVYKALETNVPPEACSDYSVCEKCQMRHLCTAGQQPIEASIDDGEIEAVLDEMAELSVAKKKYEELDSRFKVLVGERDKIIAGKYLVTAKTITVHHKATDEYDSEQRRITKKLL